MDKKQIFNIISRILSLKVKPERVEDIIKILPREKKDWQKWVLVGSDNLVLQSLYLTLRDHQLLSHLPEDLNEYLEQIHQLNIVRNTSILQEAKNIQYIFDGKGISSVYMKGTGNIFDGLYHDIGERMVYDIDILIEGERMLEAAQALMDNGYRTQKDFNPLAYPSTMHYPILLKEGCVAGVELHRLPVQYHYLKSFPPERVFETKNPSSVETGFWVMSDGNKIIHNFLHSQLMHNAHYHADVSLRNLFDLLLLSQRKSVEKTFNEFKHHWRKSNAYLKLMHKVFDLPLPDTTTKGNKFLLKRHSWTLTMTRRELMIYHFLINAFIKYIALPFRTLFDKNARNYVFARLGNKHWYKEHVNAYKRKYFRKRNLK
jgi:hypothetical protein